MFSLILSFLLGAIVALVVAFFAIVQALSVAESKLADKPNGMRTKANEQQQQQQQEQQQQQQTTSAIALGEMKLLLPGDVELVRASRKYMWAVLVSNMLFLFATEEGARQKLRADSGQSLSASGSASAGKAHENPVCVVLLDGVSVDVQRRKTKMKSPAPNATPVATRGRGIWKHKNPLILSHASRPLWEKGTTIHVVFRQGRDAEAWYERFDRASKLHGPADRDKQRAAENWRGLAELLRNRDPVIRPDFLTVLAQRIYWRLHDNPHFIEFVRFKIRKKIDAIQDELPSVLRSIDIEELTFGPRLPIVEKACLSKFEPDGEFTVDADIRYTGGFQVNLMVVLAIQKPLSIITSPFRKLQSQSKASEKLDYFLIPIRVSARVNSMEGRFRFHANAPPADSFWVSFVEQPKTDISVEYEIGGNDREFNHLQQPRLAKLAEAGLKKAIQSLFMLPSMEDIPFPSFSAKQKVNDDLLRRSRKAGSSVFQMGDAADVAMEAAIMDSADALAHQIDSHVDELMGAHKRRVSTRSDSS